MYAGANNNNTFMIFRKNSISFKLFVFKVFSKSRVTISCCEAYQFLELTLPEVLGKEVSSYTVSKAELMVTQNNFNFTKPHTKTTIILNIK